MALATSYLLIRKDLFGYNSLINFELLQSYAVVKVMIIKLCFSLVLSLGLVALVDFAYQKFTYRKKLMQTKQELKQEMKEQEGNPEIKNRIRLIQREMSRKRMLADVKKADVIITNPTHLSIVLKYDSEKMVSPMVIGKGADHLAMKIREIAKEYHIPMVENVPLARALYKTVKVNKPVPRELYKAVAEVLAFVYRLKKKEKALK